MTTDISTGQFAGGRGRAWRHLGHRGAVVLATCAVAVVAVGGVAIANIPDGGTGVFHGCVTKATGALRVIDPSKGDACTGTELAIQWDQAGINWQGNYSDTTNYAVHDAVAYQGSSYLAKKANVNISPTTATDWAVLAQAGSAGSAGRTILNGSGVPSVLIGGTGDFYIDTSAHKIYGPAVRSCKQLQCSTAWGSGTSIVGPAGQSTAAYDTSFGGNVDLPSGASTRVLTQTVPVGGDYTVVARGEAENSDSSDALFFCDLVAANPGHNAVTLDSTHVLVHQTIETVSLIGIVSIAAGGTIGINCDETRGCERHDRPAAHLVDPGREREHGLAGLITLGTTSPPAPSTGRRSRSGAGTSRRTRAR